MSSLATTALKPAADWPVVIVAISLGLSVLLLLMLVAAVVRKTQGTGWLTAVTAWEAALIDWKPAAKLRPAGVSQGAAEMPPAPTRALEQPPREARSSPLTVNCGGEGVNVYVQTPR